MEKGQKNIKQKMATNITLSLTDRNAVLNTWWSDKNLWEIVTTNYLLKLLSCFSYYLQQAFEL